MKSAVDNVGLYIIVADAEIKDHELVKKAVKECDLNYVVTSVYDGLQLMNLLLKKGIYHSDVLRAPDIIILDLDMQVLSGFEVIRRLKEIEHLKHIPLHVLSKANSQSDKLRALSLGACSVHAKPLDYKELLYLVKNICESVAA